MGDYIRQLQRFNVGEDCPVFDGLFEFCQMYTSGSIGNLFIYFISYFMLIFDLIEYNNILQLNINIHKYKYIQTYILHNYIKYIEHDYIQLHTYTYTIIFI